MLIERGTRGGIAQKYAGRLSSLSLAVDDVLMQVRTKDSFTPRASHASDFQHALIALAHCTAFVTDDKGLRKRAGGGQTP